MTRPHLHLVSDATGETLTAIVNAGMVQFDDASAEMHLWPMIRSRAQMDTVLSGIRDRPGLVLFTLVDPDLRAMLEDGCRGHGVRYVGALDPVMNALAEVFGGHQRGRPGMQHEMNQDYFNRIEAMQFTLVHDDGQNVEDLDRADVVLVGVSRTSKTPTCMYLANRGLRAANVPFVPGVPLPDQLVKLKRPLVVGLTTAPDRLAQIRRNRLLSLRETTDSDYSDPDRVAEELAEAKRVFAKYRWPTIDVTRKSIEETAAAILSHYHRRRAQPVE
ncbi:MAG: pyruvate, water dikinase regulatory protein [Pseudomonadota bacterium]|nr:pyruvate, water dikinase regulatory protein [Pseudomonadota bacterium]